MLLIITAGGLGVGSYSPQQHQCHCEEGEARRGNLLEIAVALKDCVAALATTVFCRSSPQRANVFLLSVLLVPKAKQFRFLVGTQAGTQLVAAICR